MSGADWFDPKGIADRGAEHLAMVRRREGPRPAAGSGSEAGREQHQGPATGEDNGGFTMRTALLACSVVICCCAVLAWQPAKASADAVISIAPNGRSSASSTGSAPATGCAACRANRRLAVAASGHTGDMLRRDFLSHASSDGTAMGDSRAPLRRHEALGRARTSSPCPGAPRRARRCGCGCTRRPTGPCCCRRRAAGSASASAAGKLGSARRAVFTADLTSRG